MHDVMDRRNIAANIWTARAIPIVLTIIVGYATYVTVVPLCVDYLLKKHNDHAAAITILTLYFFLLILMASSFFRLVYITTFDPPYVELGPRAMRKIKKHNKQSAPRPADDGIGGEEYDSGPISRDTAADFIGSSNDPDSPGLELFYTKDVFICEMDGKPRWCSACMNWKPDRTHHCNSSGRCIRKMDHFCPWVGGPVGENNFKFFVQFTGYTALYTLHLLVVMSVYVWKQNTHDNDPIDKQFAAILALSGFFFLFTAGMTGTSIELILRNLTQVEKLGSKTRLHTLAVLKPPREAVLENNPTLAMSPAYFEITYPLGVGITPSNESWRVPDGHPRAKSYIHAERPVASGSNLTANRPEILSAYSNNATGITPRTPGSLLGAFSGVSHTPRTSSDVLVDQYITRQSNGMGAEITHAPTREELSERDAKATRTFAILNMNKPGENPWDLGSAMANWETVMGSHILDYFLPMKRSPCCNHETTESQFMIGPSVDLLRSSVGFASPKNMPDRRTRLKNQESYYKRTTPQWRSRNNQKVHSLGQKVTSKESSSTEMRHLNGVTSRNTVA